MVITDANRRIAAAMFRVAIGQVTRLGDHDDAEYAVAALRTPSPSTLRALVGAGRGKEWLPSVIDALAEVGIAAAEDVLGGGE